MANKKVSQLTSKPSVLTTDLFPIADPSTGQLYKTTISDLGTAIGSGVSSVNGLVGAVVLDTDDIQELVSPTNKWFTDTRARAALSASSPLTYNSGTGVFGIQVANGSQNGYLSSTDWTTFNSKQAALSGTGFVKSTGGTISYDTNTYLTTSAAASTYLALAGGTMTGALFGASASFSGYVGFNGNTSPLYPVDVAGSGRFQGDLRIESTNPKIYLTDTDNNPDYFISNTDGTFTVYDVTNSVSRFTIGTTGNVNFTNAVTSAGTITGSALIATTTVSAGNSASFGGNLGTGGVVNLYKSNSRTIAGNGYTSIYADTSILGIVDTTVSTDKRLEISLASLTNSTLRTYTLPDASGTFALTSNLSSYLPLSGGTLTGALSGTSVSLSSSVTATRLILSGGTGNTGLYFGHTDRVVLANYGVGGIDFEVNGGTIVSTLFPSGNFGLGIALDAGYKLDVNGTARISGALSCTSASFSSSVTATTDLISQYHTIQDLGNTGDYVLRFKNNSGSQIAYIGRVASDNKTYYNNSNGHSFTGGAATFSSSVTATQLITKSASGAAALFLKDGSGVDKWEIGHISNALYFYNYTAGNNSMYINSSGNVGIGTTSPASFQNYRYLQITGGNDTQGGVVRLTTSAGTYNAEFYTESSGSYLTSSGLLAFYTAGSERMRITSSGNVGIGTTSPISKLQISSTTTGSTQITLQDTTYTGGYSHLMYRGDTGEFRITQNDGGVGTTFYTGPTATERMRITSGGDVYAGTTNVPSNLVASDNTSGNFYSAGFGVSTATGASIMGIAKNDYALQLNRQGNADGGIILFRRNGSSVGSISVTGSATAYNTSSDYRLKEDLKSINGLEIVNKIKVYDYKWKASDSRMDGVLAHELQEVLPYAVNGIKDGKEMQGVDYSKIVPVMVQAIKELKSELDTLKNK